MSFDFFNDLYLFYLFGFLLHVYWLIYFYHIKHLHIKINLVHQFYRVQVIGNLLIKTFKDTKNM